MPAKNKRAPQQSLALTELEPVDALPEKATTQRNSALKKIADQLQANPGQWYRIANGKRQSAYQKRARLKAQGDGFEVEVHPTTTKGISDVFARFVEDTQADGTSA